MKNTIELKKILDKKLNKIDYINDKVNIYKAYELICDMREYRGYKKELNAHEIGDIWY